MTPTEAVRFVRHVGRLWPQQRLEDGTPDAWYAAALKDINPDDAAEAVDRLVKLHPFTSLAEIVSEVRRIREERIARHPVPTPPAELADNAHAYKARLAASIERLANGAHIPRAAIATGTGAPPTPEYTQARGADRDPLRVAANQVPCPWQPCRAAVGQSCVNAAGRRLPGAPAHEGRLVDAGLAEWRDVNGVRRAVLFGAQS
ncbi:hypothetical protein ACFYY8_33695 [Streptosporangium sp. NPDC001559]|uniref:zinc finger domain-containing protein n=1 Tax=Streptosporangium sp. NPDC001559 TaxID=3366187 RepID=UPI0036ED56DC